MTDLKALRRTVAEEIGGIFFGDGGEDQILLENAVEFALLQYALACLGEPSSKMLERGNFSAASANPHDHTVRGMFNAMAAQRAKELE